MIFRRLSQQIRGRNWGGVALEFALVVLGVFLGISAANWNAVRQERAQTRLMLAQLDMELREFEAYLGTLDDYYRVAGGYGQQAFAGWANDPAVSDREFLIAAYQASQITAVSNNAVVWAQIYGADRLRNVADLQTRRSLARIMTFDYDLVSLASVATHYREEVRKVIPDAIQGAIRANCGDQPTAGNAAIFVLPRVCKIDLADRDAAQAAAALRARPELAAELRWHRAAVANQLTNVDALKAFVRDIRARSETGGR